MTAALRPSTALTALWRSGDDNYSVFEARDHVIEKAGEGYDTVDARELDYTLPANVEKLVMDYVARELPESGYRGVGNSADNVIVGSELGERLEGAAATTRSTAALIGQLDSVIAR